HLHHARRQLVAPLLLLDLVLEASLEIADRLVEDARDRLDLVHDLVVLDGDLAKLTDREPLEGLVGYPAAALHEAARTARHGLVEHQTVEPVVEAALENRLLVIAVLGDPGDLRPLDGHRAFILVDT